MPRITMLKFKIHSTTVTEADVNYFGFIIIDENLLNESGIIEYEKVQIIDINNDVRIEVYTIKSERGSGIIY